MNNAVNGTKEAVPTAGRPLMVIMDRIEGGVAAVEKRVAAVSLVVMIFAILVTIVARLLNLPIPSLGEYALVAMSPMTFLGAAFCSYMHQHITIEVVDLLKNRFLRILLRITATLAMAVFTGIFTWLAWNLLTYALSSGESLIDLGTPLWIPMGFMVLGSALMFIHAAFDIIRLCTGMPRTGGEA
ncbi:TRAP transporter small permease [Fodinicurvata fenggangensis]|uniref:TRAP transporter small permease n=1 Tax=Fodinicurvata fenggangensis TaxID=1121830 RepID=UPI000690F8BE|nr:TRAP transporter small permease subunit [Fodinicurvata fenggangensis]